MNSELAKSPGQKNEQKNSKRTREAPTILKANLWCSEKLFPKNVQIRD